MHTKLFLATVLAGAALSASATSAQAEPPHHWFGEGKLIPAGPVSVASAGALTFHLSQLGVAVTCNVTDTEVIANPASGGAGTDRMRQFKLSHCKEAQGQPPLCTAPSAIEVIAHALPWASHLEVVPPLPGIRDLINGIALEFRCSKKGKVYGTVTGTLGPKVGASVLEFEGLGGLSGPFGAVTVTGDDALTGPPGDTNITAL
jgi:hypothetical protein